MVVLKRAGQRHRRPRPCFYGVIKAPPAPNRMAPANGITAPNGAAQEELITRVYRRFDIDPAEIDYVEELHAPGTRLGDRWRPKRWCAPSRPLPILSPIAVLAAPSPISVTPPPPLASSYLIKVLLSCGTSNCRAAAFQGYQSADRPQGIRLPCGDGKPPWRSGMGKRRMAALNSFGHSAPMRISSSPIIPSHR